MSDLCGTYSGYQKHRRRGEQPCTDCRAASREYMRDYRRTNGETYRRELDRNNARHRAQVRLAEMFPQEFARLLLEEQAPITAPKRRAS